jgi:hypothetical protein
MYGGGDGSRIGKEASRISLLRRSHDLARDIKELPDVEKMTNTWLRDTPEVKKTIDRVSPHIRTSR